MLFTEQDRCYPHVLQKRNLLKENKNQWNKAVFQKELAQPVLKIAVLDDDQNTSLNSSRHPKAFM